MVGPKFLLMLRNQDIHGKALGCFDHLNFGALKIAIAIESRNSRTSVFLTNAPLLWSQPNRDLLLMERVSLLDFAQVSVLISHNKRVGA